MSDLRATIEATECDLVIIATPIDSAAHDPALQAALLSYDLQEIGKPDLDDFFPLLSVSCRNAPWPVAFAETR